MKAGAALVIPHDIFICTKLSLLQHTYYNAIRLIAVFDAISKGRQNGQKLQCLYGNPMANNFFQI